MRILLSLTKARARETRERCISTVSATPKSRIANTYLTDGQVAPLILDSAVASEPVDRTARAFLDLFFSLIDRVVLPVLNEVRPLECVPELRIVVGAEGVEIAAKCAGDYVAKSAERSRRRGTSSTHKAEDLAE